MDDPWTISVDDCPRDGPLEDRLRMLLRLALLAPSSHNSQPWRFRLTVDGVELRADRSRRLPVADPEDRELTISCAAAVGTFEAAARGSGHSVHVATCPEPGDTDLLARMQIADGPPPDPEEAGRAAVIPARRSNRGPYADAAPSAKFIAGLASETAQLGVTTTAITGQAEREAVGELVAEGDLRQLADPAFRAELASWIHSMRMGSRDGISARGFGLPDMLAPAARLAIRTFDFGDGAAAADAHRIAEGSPMLLVLSTPGDTVPEWVATGRALVRVVLGLTAAGMTASYLSQAVELPDLRMRLAETTGAPGVPQLLLRTGRPTREAEPSVRRRLEDVLDR